MFLVFHYEAFGSIVQGTDDAFRGDKSSMALSSPVGFSGKDEKEHPAELGDEEMLVYYQLRWCCHGDNSYLF